MADITSWPSPTLDWTTIKFHEPVENWTGLTPDARMIAALEFQQTGSVLPAFDEEDC
jgi:hypothetical protein